MRARVDRRPRDVEMQVVRLKHIRANQASGAITALIRSTPALWRGDKSLAPSVVSHDETNALLVSGTPEAIAQVRRLVEALDVESK